MNPSLPNVNYSILKTLPETNGSYRITSGDLQGIPDNGYIAVYVQRGKEAILTAIDGKKYQTISWSLAQRYFKVVP
jgi:hypothetical protein